MGVDGVEDAADLRVHIAHGVAPSGGAPVGAVAGEVRLRDVDETVAFWQRVGQGEILDEGGDSVGNARSGNIGRRHGGEVDLIPAVVRIDEVERAVRAIVAAVADADPCLAGIERRGEAEVVGHVKEARFVGHVGVARDVERVAGGGKIDIIAVMHGVARAGGLEHGPPGEDAGVVGNRFGEVNIAARGERTRALGHQPPEVRKLRRGVGHIKLEILRPQSIQAHLDDVENLRRPGKSGGQNQRQGREPRAAPGEWDKSNGGFHRQH